MVYLIISSIALLIIVLMVVLILFEPGLEYRVTPPSVPIDSREFLTILGGLSDADVHHHSHLEVLPNGDVFYEAELEAIRNAKHNVNLEAYIFYRGEVTKRFVKALTERARAGVKVKVVLDYIGSFSTPDSYFADLRAAGGEVKWYQPIRWYTFKRFNNRTHRELLVVDGEIGFVGGAGFADFWFKSEPKMPQWRDNMFRVRGELLIGLQTAFSENWLEASEEILASEEYFPACCKPCEDGGHKLRTPGLVIISAPSAGRSTRARILFQTLLACAKRTIDIQSPYFMPDASTRREILRAVQRGVRVRIITPGHHADHALTRASSRVRYGELLAGGATIFEYQPSMIHVKGLIVDGVWCVVGSTNFDSRSFGLNDEINVAAQDKALAARMTECFENDLGKSRAITYEEWQRRPFTEKVTGMVGRIIERQQ